MARKSLIGAAVGGVLAVAGQFICLPVFAENPVKIDIIEVVEDGSGGYKPWEDITDAMPGMTYGAIPQVRNDGEVPVMIRMCLSESATNVGGETIDLPVNTFGIEISNSWVLDNEGVTDVLDPAAGNCYKYSLMLPVGEVTEPLFTEVTLSSELGNEYENSTFSLHLEAEAVGEDIPPEEPGTPSNPDTGTNTATENFIINSSLIFLAAGILALIVRAVYSARKG